MTIEAIYLRYRNRVYKHAYKLCKNSEDAKDITQNVFLDVVKATALPIFRKEIGLKIWLSTLTRRRYLDFIGVRLVHKPEFTEFDEKVHNKIKTKVIVDELISKLSPSRALKFKAAHILGITSIEAGRILGVHPGTIKSENFKAMKQMQQM